MGIKAVIMAGGKGTRFWPLSRAHCPKQFLSILNEQTMLQMTVNRLLGFIPLEDIYISTSEQYSSLVKEYLPMIDNENIIVEPEGRDTAAAIGLAALYMMMKDDNPVMITLPADHYILEEKQYHQVLSLAANKAAAESCVVTLGVTPTRPETGYGYIKVAGNSQEKKEIYQVEQFIEKPLLKVAESIFSDGAHFWNTGIFVWKASTIMNLIKEHMPALDRTLTKIKKIHEGNGDFLEISRLYSQIEKKSIDYGVIEKSKFIYVIPVDFTWDDVGNWDALERTQSSDNNQNVVHGILESIDTKGCIVHAGKNQLVAAIGVEDMVIVFAKDALLICPKSRVQEIKKLYEWLEEKGYQEFL